MEYVQKAIELARKERLEKAAEAGSEASSESEKQDAAESAAQAVAATPSDDGHAQTTKDASVEPASMQNSAARQVKLSDEVLRSNRIVAAFDDDERAEPYRQLRTQILKEFQKNKWKTLAVTGAHTGAGKTLTALNMAVALAKDVNQTVLLVDLDFKGPSVAEGLGLSIEAGLVEHLKGEVELADILINPGIDRLSILPALHMSGPTSELLSSPKMKETLRELIERYDERLIIFDLPPLLRDDDALVFTPLVDATLLVVEQGVTTPDQVERCLQLLQGTGVVGTVFNKAV